jgi:hypothetical protein
MDKLDSLKIRKAKTDVLAFLAKTPNTINLL